MKYSKTWVSINRRIPSKHYFSMVWKEVYFINGCFEPAATKMNQWSIGPHSSFWHLTPFTNHRFTIELFFSSKYLPFRPGQYMLVGWNWFTTDNSILGMKDIWWKLVVKWWKDGCYKIFICIFATNYLQKSISSWDRPWEMMRLGAKLRLIMLLVNSLQTQTMMLGLMSLLSSMQTISQRWKLALKQ